MTEITTKPSLPSEVSPKGDFQRGNILDHLDKLTPSKGGKYFCPVCEGNDLSINKKTGALKCHTNECSWKSIMDVVAPLEKRNGKKPINGASTKRGQARRFSSPSDKDKAAAWAEIGIDSKVTEILYEIESGSHSPASANIALAAWCKEHGHNAFSAGQLLKEKLGKLKDDTQWDDDENSPLLLRDYRKIEAKFGDRLRFNTLFKCIELDGQTFEPAMGKIELIVTHGMKLKSGRDDIGDSIVKIAKEHEYSPVREYLEQVYVKHGNSIEILKDFAQRVLGATNPIHQTTVCKFLIAAVARAYEPGCQVDTALILQGAQGAGKSSFFRILTSPEWFDDSFGNASDKDERLKIHSAWILEWAELETIFKRKDMAAVKAFMTTKIDRIRPPYGRAVEFMHRNSVFCGTTNQQEFLSDSTGNRRFWVVPLSKEIDCKALERDRDAIWAAAVSMYKSGVKWWLTPEEETAMCSSRSDYESSDAWEDEIADWIEGKTEVSIQQILTQCLKIEIAQHEKRSQIRVRDILTRLKWRYQSNPVYRVGVRVRIWNPPEVLPDI
jgi:predicted P-loop ATPase